MIKSSRKFAAEFAFFLFNAGFLVSNTAHGLPESHSPYFAGQYNTQAMKICKPSERNLEKVHPAVGWVTFSENHKPATSLSGADKQQMLAPRSTREILLPGAEKR